MYANYDRNICVFLFKTREKKKQRKRTGINFLKNNFRRRDWQFQVKLRTKTSVRDSGPQAIKILPATICFLCPKTMRGDKSRTYMRLAIFISFSRLIGKPLRRARSTCKPRKALKIPFLAKTRPSSGVIHKRTLPRHLASSPAISFFFLLTSCTPTLVFFLWGEAASEVN